MQICIVYAGKQREDSNLKAISEGLARGIASQGHNVDIFNMNVDTDRKLSFYDYVLVGTTATTTWGGKIPDSVRTFLAKAGQVSGKRSFAFVDSKSIRKMKTLSTLMKVMESEGMYLKLSDVIKNPAYAEALGKRINVERNY